VLRARRHPEGAADAAVRARGGFAFLLHERDLAIALGGAVAALAVFSISVTAEPFFVTEVLRGGPLAYGVLLTAWTLGMAAGSGALARRVPRSALAAGGLVAVVLQGFGIAGAALAPVLWLALIGFVLGGVAHGVKNVLLRTLIHERVPDAVRGRAFAAYNGARNGAELGALALGGLVVGAFGARPALLAAGVGPALIGVLCLFLLTTTLERRVIHARVQG
jgi:MFS family permease